MCADALTISRAASLGSVRSSGTAADRSARVAYCTAVTSHPLLGMLRYTYAVMSSTTEFMHDGLTCSITVSEDGSVTKLVIDGDDIRSSNVRSLPLQQWRSTVRLASLAAAGREKLTRPDGSNPDAFYLSVAAAYAEYAAAGRGTGRMIASEAGVPVTTAHRWIREARIRGFLPKGRRGVTG